MTQEVDPEKQIDELIQLLKAPDQLKKFNETARDLFSNTIDIIADTEKVITCTFYLSLEIKANLLDKEVRDVFINKCREVYRNLIFQILKTGWDMSIVGSFGLSELEIKSKKEAIISAIESYFNDEGSGEHLKIEEYLKNGLIQSLNEDFMRECIQNARLFLRNFDSSGTLKNNYSDDELHDKIIDGIFSLKLTLDSPEMRAQLNKFQNNIIIKDIKYNCFTQPLFLGLKDYNNYLKNTDEKTTEPMKNKKIAPNSFIYKKYNTNSDALRNLQNSLTINNLISKKPSNTSNLKKIFTGKSDYEPIEWCGDVSSLYYFIKLIHNENKSIDNIYPFHWEVACRCFVKKDGTKFKTSDLKSQKKPKNNALIIETIASNLK